MAEIPFEPYTGQSKLRFWCQKVLPLVYDDSLSYYELLGKVVEYLNNTITDVSACEDNITALRDAFIQLQNYVNEQFEDFAPEVERIIDEMIDSGEFGEIVTDVVNGLIANEYSTTQGYAQFDYVLKDGKLYCAIVSTSGEWDATKWRETTVGADMQLLSQRLYNLNAGQVAFNESAEYVNNTVGKKLQELDSFGDNLNAGQIAFDESASYGNDTVGKKLKDLDNFDDNLSAEQVGFDESATYANGTVGKKLKDLDDFDDNLNAGQVGFDESATYANGTVGKKLKDLDDFDDNLNAGQVGYNAEGSYNNATVGKELQELKGSLNTITPFDSTPTSGSLKGVTSGGVKSAIDNANAISPFDWLSPNETLVTSNSLWCRKAGNILVVSGYIDLNGSVAGNNAVLGSFSNLLPSGERRIYCYGTYNNNAGYYFLKIDGNGQLMTATGGGTFTGQLIVPDAATFM